MKVIFTNTSFAHYISYLRSYFYFTMSVPDEGYSTHTLFALHYISSFLFLFYYELTWWRLFHKHVIHTTLAIFVSIFIVIWAYLMKVIPQTCHSHYIRYLRFYFYFTMSVPDEGYSINTSFALYYISSFLFLFYYERTWWRLFHKHIISTSLAIFVSIFILLWTYLMKVITQTRYSLIRTTLYIFVSIFILLWAYLMKVIPQTRHSHTTLAIFVPIFILLWAYLIKVIPQTRHSHYIIYLRFYFYFTMSVHDEGYSTNMSFALLYISYFLFLFYCERTWWRLFHKHVIRTTLAIFVSIFILLWAYLMKVIPQTFDEGYFYFTNTLFAHYISSFLFLFYYLMKVIPQTRHSHYISYLRFRFYFYFTSFLWAYLMKVIPQTRHSCTTLAIFVSIFILLWAYLMKVIPQTLRTTLAIFVSIYFTMSVPDEGYSTNTSFTLH